jgi:hypothetical protein
MVAFDSEGNKYNLLNGVDKKGNVMKGRSSEERDFDEGIYLFLRRNDIEVPYCAPTYVLDTLVKNGYVL